MRRARERPSPQRRARTAAPESLKPTGPRASPARRRARPRMRPSARLDSARVAAECLPLQWRPRWRHPSAWSSISATRGDTTRASFRAASAGTAYTFDLAPVAMSATASLPHRTSTIAAADSAEVAVSAARCSVANAAAAASRRGEEAALAGASVAVLCKNSVCQRLRARQPHRSERASERAPPRPAAAGLRVAS